jgi:hypothetical protein
VLPQKITFSPPTIIDTGATGHYLLWSFPLSNKKAFDKGINNKLPYGSYMTSTHTDFLPIIGIPYVATVAHIFLNLKFGSIRSVGQLCDYGCEATFTKHTVCITANGNMVPTGTRYDDAGGLWIMDNLSSPKTLQANAIVGTVSSSLKKDTITNCDASFHASLFLPPLSTWCDAIDAGRFMTWRSLTTAQVRTQPP